MGNFFKKRWVTIIPVLFICFMASAVCASDICCVCTGGIWVETAGTTWAECNVACQALDPPQTANNNPPVTYNKRSNTTCGSSCSNAASTCYRAYQKFCWHPETGIDKYNACKETLNPNPYMCVLEYASGDTNSNNWPACPTELPICDGSNWIYPTGYTWTNSPDNECVSSGGAYAK